MWEQGKLLQRAEFNGEYYGISIDSLDNNVACIQIVDTVKDVKNRAKELGKNPQILTFYIEVDEQERMRRMKNRGDSISSIQKRIEIDKEKFQHAKEVADYIIPNKNVAEAVEDILSKIC